MSRWSKPFHGLTHLGESSDRRRVSVQAFSDGRAELFKWYEGCGFSPITEMHDSVELAKAEGERWINEISIRGAQL